MQSVLEVLRRANDDTEKLVATELEKALGAQAAARRELEDTRARCTGLQKDLDKMTTQKNYVTDAFENTRKRLSSRGGLKYLRGLVQDSDHRRNHLVAIAAFRAEEQRASFPLDIATATAGFERNPFRWQVDETRRSQAEVAFLWKWTSGLDAEEQQK